MVKNILKRGFTLIELLVVIAIVSTLSGIALINFSEAQTKAKVSRATTDLRSLSSAIESYHVDNNRYPRMVSYRFYTDPSFDVISGETANGIPSKVLSTPVAYITSAYILDPFIGNDTGIRVDERIYTYQDLTSYRTNIPTSQFWPRAVEHYGSWRLASVGPDRTFDHGFTNSAQLPYDPTNGTISLGNLWYSHRYGGQPTMPMPALLGTH